MSESIYGDDDTFKIPNFKKYVDQDFEPLLDSHGKMLFESEVIDDPKLSLSADAKKVLKSIFNLTVKLSKESLAK